MGEVKIVTYNAHSCVGSDGKYSVDRISQLLACENPDIVCLQEIEVNRSQQKTRIWSESHSDNQPNRIGNSLGLNHIVFAPAISSIVVEMDRGPLLTPLLPFGEMHDSREADGQFGICILSRYPILEKRILEYAPFRKKTRRNAIACLVQIPTKSDGDGGTMKVWILNTHLGCHTGEEQYRQSLELSNFIDSLINENETYNKAHPEDFIAGVILCGDLNSLPIFRSIQNLKSIGMLDTWEVGKGIGSGCSFPAAASLPGCSKCRLPPFLRLDYIFTKSCYGDNGGFIHAHSIHVVNKSNRDGVEIESSDHLALSAIFTIGIVT